MLEKIIQIRIRKQRQVEQASTQPGHNSFTSVHGENGDDYFSKVYIFHRRAVL